MDLEKEVTVLDDPQIIKFIFYPRRQSKGVKETEKSCTIKFNVDEGVDIGCRFYKTNNPKESPNILLFHGNGEIAADYDPIARLYRKIGVNLIVTDYRGYGISSGTPSFSSMLLDAKTIYQKLRMQLLEEGYTGSFSIMGRSLGSASAITIAERYQDQLTALIVESGFANTIGLLTRLGLPPKFPKTLEEKLMLTPVIRNVKIPTLIIHGENDMIIPVSEGVKLHNNASSPNKRLILIPNSGHNDLLIVDPNKYMKSIEEIIRVVRDH
ncbi:MAG: alpha/beta hydrolase [Candidatus Hodarchaeales archaeon]